MPGNGGAVLTLACVCPEIAILITLRRYEPLPHILLYAVYRHLRIVFVEGHPHAASTHLPHMRLEYAVAIDHLAIVRARHSRPPVADLFAILESIPPSARA